MLSCDGDIYLFGSNYFGEVGQRTLEKEERFPIKLEVNNKFIDIASHPYEHISMSQSIDGIYYVWGRYEDKHVWSPQPTKYESFEDILISNDNIYNIKALDKLIKFKDSFVKTGFYSKNFEEIKKLGFGSFGIVFKVKIKEDIDYPYYYRSRGIEYSAIKRIEFTPVVGKDKIIREYLNYLIITRNCFGNEYLVKHFDAWFEESVVANQPGISLYIQMELCDKTLKDVINEFYNNWSLIYNGTLTPVGYYIASQIFTQILEGFNYLHERDLIHRDSKPANILLKKCDQKGLCVKIADFGIMVTHKFTGQSHTANQGTYHYMAPEVKKKAPEVKYEEYGTKSDIYSLGVIFKELIDCKTDE